MKEEVAKYKATKGALETNQQKNRQTTQHRTNKGLTIRVKSAGPVPVKREHLLHFREEELPAHNAVKK